MNLRRISDADIDAIFEIRVATWHNAFGSAELAKLGITHESVREQLAKTHCGWLVEIEGRPIGFAIGNTATGEMWVVAVLREFEGQGIGRALIAEVEQWLASEGWSEAWLTTDTDDAYRAVGFYRRLGWEDWKVEGGDRYMRKQLDGVVISPAR